MRPWGEAHRLQLFKSGKVRRLRRASCVIEQHQAAVTNKNKKHNSEDVPLDQFSFAGGTLRSGPGRAPAAMSTLHLNFSPLTFWGDRLGNGNTLT